MSKQYKIVIRNVLHFISVFSCIDLIISNRAWISTFCRYYIIHIQVWYDKVVVLLVAIQTVVLYHKQHIEQDAEQSETEFRRIATDGGIVV